MMRLDAVDDFAKPPPTDTPGLAQISCARLAKRWLMAQTCHLVQRTIRLKSARTKVADARTLDMT